jgi:hypothetical protein
MGLKLANRATSLLASGISAVSTVVPITSGDESLFPTLSPGEWFPITVADAAGNSENMRCTARSGVSLTVTRAQEGSVALAFSAGARVDIRLTAQAFLDAVADASRLNTGLVNRALLGDGLQAVASEVVSLDTIEQTGPYRHASDATGAPVAQGGYVDHVEGASGAAFQEWRSATTADAYMRWRTTGVWGAWTQIRISEAQQDARYLRLVGGTLTGKLNTVASATGGAGLSVPHGAAPTSPVNGDLWSTTAGLHFRADGVTLVLVPAARTIATSGLASGGGDLSANRTIDVPIASQAEAEAGTDNTKATTSLRVAQAIAATAAKKAAQLVFTANGTWTKPAGAVMVLIQVWGSGGGGAPGSGGGGGGYSEAWVLASALGATEAVVVGAAATAGNNGSQSSFAGIIGSGGQSPPVPGTGGAGGSGNALTNENGGAGSSGAGAGANTFYAGAGGGSSGGTSIFGGNRGTAPGGGGNTSSGTSGRGEVRVTTFF